MANLDLQFANIKRIFTDKTFLVTLVLAILALSLGTIHLADIDLKTILALLTLMITIAIYEKLHLLRYMANVIIEKCQSIRAIVMVILLFSFFGAMLFTNDVAILTLIPIVFNIRRQVKLPTIGLVSLMTVYANLGSAMTPFGNPQNLYLVSYFHLDILAFLKLSLPIGLISLATLFIVLFGFSKAKIAAVKTPHIAINLTQVIILVVTTLIVLMGVLSVISIWFALIASLACAFWIKGEIVAEVDYGIILTFINFFIIVGAVSRIPLIHDFLATYMTHNTSVFTTSVGMSQVISNVPAAVLLSKFTDHVAALYLGVTVGGLGTFIASLANLLALRQYQAFVHDGTVKKFIRQFTLINVVYLVIFFGIGFVLVTI